MTERQKKEMNKTKKAKAKEIIDSLYMNKPYNLLINHKGQKTLLVNTACVRNCLKNKVIGFNSGILSIRNAPKNINIIDVIYENGKADVFLY